MSPHKLPTLRSIRYSIGITNNGKTNKIFQVGFHSGKESKNTHLFINFPYFQHPKGILSLITLQPNDTTPGNVSLIPGGKLTTHLVKYSHPIDGKAHFSADGKIYTSLKTHSKRLDTSIGHLFTIQTQGLDSFELLKIKRLTLNATDLDFKIENETPEAYKFVGRWFKSTELKGTINKNVPKAPIFRFRGENRTGFIISGPEKTPVSDFVLLLTCEPIPLLEKSKPAVFSFIGGFEYKPISEAEHFLSCIYPADDFDNLSKFMGSVDYTPISNLEDHQHK